MKRLLLLTLLLLTACGASPQELFDTAELELLQRNYPHATSLYREIIAKHPDSEFAVTARQRLAEIEKQIEAERSRTPAQ
jgi:outer membrane protein assembly factor BamD (BamD/ComL family)